MCNCTRKKKDKKSWVLITKDGSQYFGSRLEVDAAYVANGNQGTIRRVP